VEVAQRIRFSGSHAVHSHQCRSIRHLWTARRPPHAEFDGRIAWEPIPPEPDTTAPSFSRTTGTNARLDWPDTLATSVVKHPSRCYCRNRQSVRRHARPYFTNRRTINGTPTIFAQQRTAPPTHPNPTDRTLSKSASLALRRLGIQQRIEHQRQRHQRRVPVHPHKPRAGPTTTDGAMEQRRETLLQQPRPSAHARCSAVDPARAPQLRQPEASHQRSTVVPPGPTDELPRQPHDTPRFLRSLDAATRQEQKQRQWLRPWLRSWNSTAFRTVG